MSKRYFCSKSIRMPNAKVVILCQIALGANAGAAVLDQKALAPASKNGEGYSPFFYQYVAFSVSAQKGRFTENNHGLKAFSGWISFKNSR